MGNSNLPSGNERDSLAPYNNPQVSPEKVTIKVCLAFEVYLEVEKRGDDGDYMDADIEDAAELWAKSKGLPKPDWHEDISWVS